MKLQNLLVSAVLCAAPMAWAQNLAIVNGKPVPSSRMQTFVQQFERQGQTVDETMKQQIREEIITREVFAQEAVRRGLNATDSYREQMELARQSILIRALMDQVQSEVAAMGDAQLKAEYDKLTTSGAGAEYRASHILVKTEAEAKEVAAAVNQNPQMFAALAKKKSLDPGSGAQGGDLGWADAAMFVPEFSKAMTALKKGQISAPVQTQFGWHVIQLVDTRQAAFPPFESVKEQLRQQLAQDRLAVFQRKVREAARIQ